MSEAEDVDVAIIGGGPAGLSAALCLGRGQRRVVVLDAGSPRHAVAEGVHNFLTREGLPPAELRRVAWEQMAAYPSVRRATEGPVERLSWDGSRWIVEDALDARWRARAALLATGMIDQHPDIPGYRERWGHGIHHCPFCHGWEVRGTPVAVLGAGESPVHLGRLLRGWTDDVVVLTNGATLDDEHASQLRASGVPVDSRRVTALTGEGRSLEAIHFDDGTTLARSALFVATAQRQVPIVERLGLERTEQGYVRIDMMMQTSLPMLWAAGDLTSRLQQVIEAAAQGFRAGAMIQAKLTIG